MAKFIVTASQTLERFGETTIEAVDRAAAQEIGDSLGVDEFFWDEPSPSTIEIQEVRPA